MTITYLDQWRADHPAPARPALPDDHLANVIMIDVVRCERAAATITAMLRIGGFLDDGDTDD